MTGMRFGPVVVITRCGDCRLVLFLRTYPSTRRPSPSLTPAAGLHVSHLVPPPPLPNRELLTANDKRTNAGAVGLDGAEDEPLGDKVERRDAKRANGEGVQSGVSSFGFMQLFSFAFPSPSPPPAMSHHCVLFLSTSPNSSILDPARMSSIPLDSHLPATPIIVIACGVVLHLPLVGNVVGGEQANTRGHGGPRAEETAGEGVH